MKKITVEERLLQKDAGAFEELYDCYSRLVYAVAFRILGQETLAEQATHDVFLQVWRNAARYSNLRGPLNARLVTLSRDAALDLLHCNGQSEASGHDNDTQVRMIASRVAALDEQDEARRVLAAMNTLQIEQRQAIELAYFEGLKHSEIATKLACPAGMVKTWIQNGLKLLQGGWHETSENEMNRANALAPERCEDMLSDSLGETSNGD